jgi:hypothetical protein
MKKLWIIALTAALSLGAIAFAGKPANPGAGGQCVQAGIGFLQDTSLLTTAAKKGIDYSLLGPSSDSPFKGLLTVDLDPGSFLSLGQVVKLHTSNPELFSWCID